MCLSFDGLQIVFQFPSTCAGSSLDQSETQKNDSQLLFGKQRPTRPNLRDGSMMDIRPTPKPCPPNASSYPRVILGHFGAIPPSHLASFPDFAGETSLEVFGWICDFGLEAIWIQAATRQMTWKLQDKTGRTVKPTFLSTIWM